MNAALLVLTLICGETISDLIATLEDQGLSNGDRETVMMKLTFSDVTTVAPEMLRVIRRQPGTLQELGSIGFYGSTKPWINDRYSASMKTRLAAEHVFDVVFNGREDPAKSDVLVGMLNDEEFELFRSRILLKLREVTWGDCAEESVAKVVWKPSASDYDQKVAMWMLITRDPDKYLPMGLAFVKSGTSSRIRLERHGYVFSIGSQLLKLSDEQRQAIMTSRIELESSNQ